MEIILNSQLDNVERRMIKLIDSITTRNPSTEALSELLEADDSLSKALQLLSRHQHNVERINSLRKQISDMENTYTTLSRLVEATRTEVTRVKPSFEKTASIDVSRMPFSTQRKPSTAPATLTTSSTVENSAGKSSSTHSEIQPQPVRLDDLIGFGKRIAKFSVPPSARGGIFAPPAKVEPPLPSGANQTKDTNTEQDAAPSPAQPPAGAPPGPEGDPSTGAWKTANLNGAIALEALSDEQKAWLDHVNRTLFFPWPNEVQIKGGSLARIRNWTADDFVRVAESLSGRDGGGGGAGRVEGADSHGSSGSAADVNANMADGGAAESAAAEAAGEEDRRPSQAYVANQNIQLTQPLPVNEFADDAFDLYDPDI